MCRTRNVYEAEKQMDKLIHLHGNPADANTIAIKNLLVVMMYTTTLLEEGTILKNNPSQTLCRGNYYLPRFRIYDK